MADFKLPKEVIFISVLPETTTVNNINDILKGEITG
jgi:hypothetical protein